jgi:hypothetical protein
MDCKLNLTASGSNMSTQPTPKIHATPIRDVLLAAIENSDLLATEKAELAASVNALSAQHLQAVTAGLAREGLARLPDAMGWLRRWI